MRGWLQIGAGTLALVGLLLLSGARPAAQPPRGEFFTCTVPVSTATTIQTVGGSCLGTNARSLYVTDVLFSTNAAGIAADSFNTLKYGTGTTCGTGTVIFWGAVTAAATQAFVNDDLLTPIRIPPNNDICWINSTAGSKFLTISGYFGQ